MKSCFIHLRMLVMANFLLFLSVVSITSCKNHQEDEGHFEILNSSSTITSISSGNGDTLLVGNEHGELFAYTSPSSSTSLGVFTMNRSIYCAYPMGDSLFIGTSDEGLKLISRTGDSLCSFIFPNKGYKYAVYKILCHEDTLFCATSNGLAMLKLKPFIPNTLQVLYPDNNPKDTTVPACKFRNLQWSDACLSVGYFFYDTILTFIHGDYKNPVKTCSPRRDRWKDTISIAGTTYIYDYSEKKLRYRSQGTHFALLIRRHDNNKLFAVTQAKDVYTGTTTKVRWNNAWSQCLKEIPGNISDAVIFPNGSCLFLCERTLYKGRCNKLSEFPGEVRCFLYRPELNKLYIALSDGFVSFELDKEKNPLWDTEAHYSDYESVPIQTFSCKGDTILLGTMHNGCILIDTTGHQVQQGFLFHDIRDIQPDKDKNIYVLTANDLYVLDGIDWKRQNNEGIVNLILFNGRVYGVNQDGRFYSITFEDGQLATTLVHTAFNCITPKTILEGDDLLFETNEGLFVAQNRFDALKPVEIGSFWRTHNIWSFIIAGVMTIAVISVFLIYQKKKKKLKNKRVTRLLNHQYMTIPIEKLPHDGITSTDWVTQTSSEYEEKCKEFKKRIEKVDFTIDSTVEELQDEIENGLMKYAFAAELYCLRQTFNTTTDGDKKENLERLFLNVDNLSTQYLEKIVTYDENSNRYQGEKKYFFHLWILALMSTDENEKMFIDTKFLTKYIQPHKKKTIFPVAPSLAKTHLRKVISGDTPSSIIPKDHKSELFSELKNALNKQLGESKEYSAAKEKSESLEELKKELYKGINNTITSPKTWKNIIDSIKIQSGYNKRGNKEKTFYVFDGSVLKEWIISPSNNEIQKTIDVSVKDLSNKEIRIVWKDNIDNVTYYYESLCKLFNESEKNTIREEIKAIIDYWIGYNESHDKKLQIDTDSFIEKMSVFYETYFKLMFEKESFNNNDHNMALHLWLLYIVMYQSDSVKYTDISNDSLRQYLNRMQNQEADEFPEDTKIEEIKNILHTLKHGPHADIKPKIQYEDLIDEWKKKIAENISSTGK